MIAIAIIIIGTRNKIIFPLVVLAALAIEFGYEKCSIVLFLKVDITSPGFAPRGHKSLQSLQL